MSEALDAVFQHMVAKDPRQRYASMAELVEDLEALQNGRKPEAWRWLTSRPSAAGDDVRRSRAAVWRSRRPSASACG